MKRMIVDVYRFIYRISGAKMLSVTVAVIYVTILNMIVLSGLSLLLEGWMTSTAFIHKLFIYPYFLFTGVLMLWLTYRYKPSKKAIAKEAKTTKDYTFILIYTLAAVILLLYMRYGVRINFSERKKMAYIESALSKSKNVIIKEIP